MNRLLLGAVNHPALTLTALLTAGAVAGVALVIARDLTRIDIGRLTP